MEQRGSKWDLVYQSLKDNWKQLNDAQKKLQLKMLTKASEATLDRWIEMDEKLSELKQEMSQVELEKVSFRSKGTSYFQLNMFQEAINQFMIEKKENITNKNLIELYIGFSQLYLNQFDKAKETFLFIIHMRPSLLEQHFAYVGLGCLHGQQLHFEEAITFFEKAHSLTSSADVVYNLGVCHFQLHEFQLAINYLKKAIEMNPEDGESYYYLGRCYFELHNTTKGFESWITALQIVETKELLISLAYEFEQHGFHLAAVHCYKRLQTLGFREIAIEHGIAWNYGLLNEKKEAKQLFNRLMNWEPANTNIFISYLWLLKTWGEENNFQYILNKMPKEKQAHPLIKKLINS